MATIVSHRIVPFLKRHREHRIVVEEAGRGYAVTEGTIDHRERQATVVCRYLANDFRGIRRRTLPFDHMVVVLGGKRATTVTSVARVRRTGAGNPIEAGELDTLVFKALWEFLNRYRPWSAKKMGVTDLDVALAAIEVLEVSLDGHRLLDPTGFRGSTLAVRFRGTFTPRGFVSALERFRTWVDEVAVAERGSLLADLTLAAPEGTFVDIGGERTTVFARRDADVGFSREVPWGSAAGVESVRARFGTTPEVAEDILERVSRGRASERLSRVVDRLVYAEVVRFGELIGASRGGKEHRPPAPPFIHLRTPPPRILFHFARLPGTLVGTDTFLRTSGFTVRAASKRDDALPGAEAVVALVRDRQNPHAATLNQLLKRRARWLIAQP